MEAIQEQLNKPLSAGILGFVVGLIIGWFVIGWGLWPVAWTDASPEFLRQDLREDYLRMAIDSYNTTSDQATAQARWQALGSKADETLQAVEAAPGLQNPNFIESFKTIVGAAAPISQGEEAEPGGGNAVFLYACVFILLVAAAGGFFYLSRGRKASGELSVASQAARLSQETERTDFEALGKESPIGQYMTTYMIGDDLFDDSFSIDSPAGEFLGECGVGIAETIGVGEPKRVSSYEVWIFDKNDIQTVTKVLMSEHAYSDIASRERLAAKGEPVLAEPDGQFVLETETLHLVARIVDMTYGGGALPENSHFERMTLELAVWAK